MSDTTSGSVPFVRRVRIKNFRSIADCDVELGPLTVLLGSNAAGKSNFLDAISLVVGGVGGLGFGPTNDALLKRGGMQALLRRGANGQVAAQSFSIDLECWLPTTDTDEAATVRYSIEYGPDPSGELACLVLNERLTSTSPRIPPFELRYAPGGAQTFDGPIAYQGAPDVPALKTLGATGEYRRFWGLLMGCRFHDLDVSVLRELDQDLPRRVVLGSSGQHLGRVLGELEQDHPAVKERLDSYLSAVVENALGIDEAHEGRYSTVAARFLVGGSRYLNPQVEVFRHEVLSEGTLRAAGVLAAIFQPRVLDGSFPLIAIEEPEKALHPATVGALYEALTDAAERTQIIITTQSSDLLDDENAKLDDIRVVANVEGVTYVGPVDGNGRALVENGQMTISELHRSGQMLPRQVGFPVAERGPRL